MRWYERIIAAHLAVTDAVSHSQRLQSERYFVWEEDGKRFLMLNNQSCEPVITGVTDLFTKQEFDPWADAMEQAFANQGIAWKLSDIQYEKETGFYHYTWDWEVCDGNTEI